MMMEPTKLPHLKETPLEIPPFVSMDDEIARRQGETHPHYDESDKYGNVPAEHIPMGGRKRDAK
jgi:hypothetical protein